MIFDFHFAPHVIFFLNNIFFLLPEGSFVPWKSDYVEEDKHWETVYVIFGAAEIAVKIICCAGGKLLPSSYMEHVLKASCTKKFPSPTLRQGIWLLKRPYCVIPTKRRFLYISVSLAQSVHGALGDLWKYILVSFQLLELSYFFKCSRTL